METLNYCFVELANELIKVESDLSRDKRDYSYWLFRIFLFALCELSESLLNYGVSCLSLNIQACDKIQIIWAIVFIILGFLGKEVSSILKSSNSKNDSIDYLQSMIDLIVSFISMWLNI